MLQSNLTGAIRYSSSEPLILFLFAQHFFLPLRVIMQNISNITSFIPENSNYLSEKMIFYLKLWVENAPNYLNYFVSNKLNLIK